MALGRPPVDGRRRNSERGRDGGRVHEPGGFLTPTAFHSRTGLAAALVSEEHSGDLPSHRSDRRRVGYLGSAIRDGIKNPVEHGGDELRRLAGVVSYIWLIGLALALLWIRTRHDRSSWRDNQVTIACFRSVFRPQGLKRRMPR